MSVAASADKQKSLAHVHVNWSNLNYTLHKTTFDWSHFKRVHETHTILSDVSGAAHSGQLIAVLGPSGAGKTCLLAALSQRLRCPAGSRSAGRIGGTIRIDGVPVSRAEMIARSAFVTQFDIAPDALTVREHVEFMCQLRGVRLAGRCDRILRAVGLQRSAESVVAVLSGGERKKLNMATEILTDPCIIFCDEPTTGLDSFSALSVVQTLRDLAHSKLVICSIHQPTSEVFECFTHVILLRSGSVVFQGGIQQAVRAFAYSGRVCPRAYNTADFFITTISDRSFKVKCVAHYDNDDPHVEEKSIVQERVEGRTKGAEAHITTVCWPKQVCILLRRLSKESRRTTKEFLYKLTTFALTAIFIGCLYLDVELSDQRSIQDVSGFVLNLTAQIIFATAYNVVYYYPSRMPVLRRETGERIYSLSAFYVANVLAGIPRSALECCVFLAIVQPCVSFIDGVWMFVTIGATLSLVAIPSTAYGLMLSGMFESIAVSTAMAPPFDVFLCLAAGVYVRLEQLRFLRYMSPFFYANEALMIVIWKQVDRLGCGNSGANGTVCLVNGEEVLQSMNFGTTYATLWLDYAGLMGCTIAMNMIGFYGVRRMVNRTGFY